MNEPVRGAAVWIVGRPAAGKTTLARGLIAKLHAEGRATLWLDSDDLRPVLTPGASYDAAGRDRFYEALAHVAVLGVAGGVVVVISATAARATYRRALRARVEAFYEIFLDCDAAELRRRDPKGLYRASDDGEISNLPGVGATFDTPAHADLVLDSGQLSTEELTTRAWTGLRDALG